MLDSWLPFLIYGLLAFAIPLSMVAFSFIFSTRPKARTRARTIPFESGVSTGPRCGSKSPPRPKRWRPVTRFASRQ